MGESLKRVEDHKFLGVTFDEKLTWKKHINTIVNGITSRTHALKRLSAKSACENPTRVIRLHEALVHSVWKYGSIAYASMGEAMWERMRRCHAHCVKAYAGVPNFVSYELVCDTLGVRRIKDEICQFAKKRLVNMIRFSPLGGDLIKRGNPSTTVSSIYRCPSDVLLNDSDMSELMGTQ